MAVPPLHIGVLLFDNVTQLDLAGPYEVLSRVPGAVLYLVAQSVGPVRSDSGLVLHADTHIAACPPLDILCVPGGPDVSSVMESDDVIAFVRAQHALTRFTTSVCTGALILGAAGVLRGVRATTHWTAMEQLAGPQIGAHVVTPRQRVVVDGKIVTGGGVTAGIDFALVLVALLAGEEMAQTIQLAIEYAPDPPYHAGEPETAPPAVVAKFASAAASRGGPDSQDSRSGHDDQNSIFSTTPTPALPSAPGLDYAGLYEVLSRVPGAILHLVAQSIGPVRSDSGLQHYADTTLAACPPLDILCVPGGPGVNSAMESDDVIAFIRAQHAHTRFTTSVCTGALILGAAGVLRGVRATTHWASMHLLAAFGAHVVTPRQRVVVDGKIVTGGGVTAGIDFALVLVALLAGEEMAQTRQLALEYAPDPPYHAGDPETAPPAIVAAARARMAVMLDDRARAVERAAARLAAVP